jgi:hypothetical protein
MDNKFLLPTGGAVERLLIHGACTDSFHDFGGGHFLPRNDDSNPGLYHVRFGLPFTNDALKDIPLTRAINTVKYPDVLHDENQLFQELFNGFPLQYAKKIMAPPAKMETVANDFAQYLESLGPSAINGMREQVHTFQNTIHGSETYTIRLLTQRDLSGNFISDIKPMFNKGSKPSVRPVVLPSCTITTDTFYNFFGSDQINLLFDAQCIKVMKLLQYAIPRGVPLNVRRIHNREVINDPAPKTFEDAPGIWNSGMKHSVEFDADPNYINYQHYEPKDGGDPLDRDKFYSALDFKLSPLHNAPFSMKTGNKPAAGIEVLQNGSLILHSDNDPHISNRISQCWMRIKKAFDKGGGARKNHIEVAAHYQCKRSGDWLQALSCLDLERKYKSYTDGNPTAAPESALAKKNIILVTHDRVLLWYAIMIGIDVLFTYRSNPKSGEKEDDDDDEDEEEVGGDEVAIVAENGSVKKVPNRAFLIYFSNDKRSKTPEEMKEELIKNTSVRAHQIVLDGLKTRMSQYNTWLENLYDEIMDEIETNMNLITNDVANVSAAEIKQRNVAIVEIYRSFMKLTTLDFQTLAVEFIQVKHDNFNARYQERAGLIAQKATTADYANKYSAILTVCADAASSYLREFTNYEQLCNTVPTKESLVSSRSSYKSNEYFMNMPVFHKLYMTRSGSLFKDEAYVAKYAAWLVENISTFEWAAGYLLVNTRKIKKDYFDNPKIRKVGEIFFFDKFANNIEVIYKARFAGNDNFMKHIIEKNAAGGQAELFSRDKRAFREQDLVDLQAPLIIIEETRQGLANERGSFYDAQPRLNKRAEFNRKSKETKDKQLITVLDLPVGDDADAELEGVDVEIVNVEHGKILDGVEEIDEEEDALDEEIKRGALGRNKKGLRPDEIVEEPPSGFRQFSKSIFSMAGPLRKYISGLFYPTIKAEIDASEYVRAARGARPRAAPGALSAAAQQAMGEGRASAPRGGASTVNTDGMINPAAILPTTAHIMVLLYVNQLVISIDGYDSSEDTDCYYYMGLGRLTSSLLEHTATNEYNKMVEIIYNTIPSGNWNKEGQFAVDKDYELTLTHVGKQVAAQAIGRMSGDLPRFDFGAVIPADSGKLYEQLRSDVKGKDFTFRKMAIISRLLDLQIRPGPALSMAVASSFATSTTSSSNASNASSNGSTPGPGPVFRIPPATSYNSTLKNRLLALKQSMARSVLVNTTGNLPTKKFGPIGISNNENPSSYNNTRRVVPAPAAAAAGGGRSKSIRKTLKRRARKTRRM